MFKYEIGGKTYVQKPLVLGQIPQLLDCLKGTAISNFHPLAIYNQLRDRISKIFAVILTEEGTSPRDKDLKAVADEFEFSVDLETAIKVIEDFFACNPTASIWERLEGMPAKIFKGIPMPAGLRRPSSSSHGETSPAGTISSGDSPRTSADPISDTASEK